jgi:DTW domain-containing protein
MSSPCEPVRAFVPRAVCSRCTRPKAVCLCAHLGSLSIRTELVILQHPRESTVPIGTAKLAELVISGVERHIGVEFSELPRVRALLQKPEAPAILLFPGPAALNLETCAPAGKVTLVVIDGTWWQANKILKKNPELAKLPRYSLRPAEPSNYRIRREPARDCVSTIEAITQALCILERDPALSAALLQSFNALVETQLQYAAERGARRHVARKRVPRPRPLPAWLSARASDLVVGYGEANAWPRGTPLGAHPEVVHWAAERVMSGERFEAFIKPRHPLSPSFSHHTGIDASRVNEGQSWASFSEAWQAFVRPDDVLCGWGFFASEVLRRDGAAMPERLDLRSRLRQLLKSKLGDASQAAAFLHEPISEPWVAGRTGVRLAGLTSVTRALLRERAGHSEHRA